MTYAIIDTEQNIFFTGTMEECNDELKHLMGELEIVEFDYSAWLQLA